MLKSILDYNFPEDLKEMSIEEMELLAIEIRSFLISNISKTGGHLASNLGVVELTIALHKLLDTPKDKIVWDVGHQSYVHKILTGRAKDFHSLRQSGGISGFPKSTESIFDAFDTGHSSTSISIINGLAKSRDLKGEDYKTVAIIGDGALTGGLAYEALNNLTMCESNSIVIINDNGMSISPNTGGMSSHLSKLRVSKGYHHFKEKLTNAVEKVPIVGKGIHTGLSKIRNTIKYALVDGVFFEELGFTYIGPVDGHNIKDLIYNLNVAQNASGPVALHVITKKGKGYKNAENNPGKFHGTGPFDPTTGATKKSTLPTYSQVFGNKLVELGKKDDKIVAISAAMIDGTGLEKFNKEFPKRTFDVGIAEAHAVTFAAGLASGGMKPVVAVYSTFLQRAYDQIIMDVCLQRLPVIFAIDRAGNVGADGETHHGIFDLSMFSHMPNMTVLAPRDGKELEAMLDFAISYKGPVAIRYPRGENGDIKENRLDLTEGAEIIKEGRDVEIWACGSMVKKALSVMSKLEKEGYSVGLCNARYIKPIDEKKIMESAKRTKCIVTIEDNILAGGFGEKVAAFLCGNNNVVTVKNIGWPNAFIEHGTCDELYKAYSLDEEGLVERIREFIER